MKKIVLCASGASLCIVLAAALAPRASAGASPPGPAVGVTAIGTGLPLCVDCEAPSAMSVTLCHTASVNITIGSNQIGSFGTGQSTSACVTAPSVAPDTCVWIEYHFVCQRSGFFGFWDCSPVGANVVVGDNPFC